jgi:hypothetical protein
MSGEDRGWHDSLVAEAVDGLDREDRDRLVSQYAVVLAELDACPGKSGAPIPAGDEEEEPPVRWSPAARGRPRCADHRGHIQHVFRMLARRALDSADPLWQAWQAFADSAELAEQVMYLEAAAGLPGPAGAGE